MEWLNPLILLGLLFGFFMAWGVGANDVANAMGTSVGAKVLTIKQAIIIAAIFEAAGAILGSGAVTHTLKSGIIDSQAFIATPNLFVFGMLAALLSAGSWLAVATYFSWPVSTTHTIIGALIGFGSVALSPKAVYWSSIIHVFLSWIITPMIAGVLAYLIFMSIYKLVLDQKTPLLYAKRYLPFYVFFVIFMIGLVTLTQSFAYLNIKTSPMQNLTWIALIAISMAIASKLLLMPIKETDSENHRSIANKVEKSFGILTLFTACSLAFAHGSNDAANAMGPLAAIVEIIQNGGIKLTSPQTITPWIPLFGAFGIILGLITCGYRVIKTVGDDITLLTPSRAFAAQLATATTVIIASSLGLPISTTQTLVGAVLGVGFARGISSINLQVIGKILSSWVITLPVGAAMSIIFFYIIQLCFTGLSF